MLSEINKLARQYVPEEQDFVTDEEYIEYLFKLESCCDMDLFDIVRFLTYIIDNDQEVFIKISNGFMCAVTYSVATLIPKIINFTADTSHIQLKFCKLRICSRKRWYKIRAYYKDHFEDEPVFISQN